VASSEGPGRGSTFRVTLPVRPSPAESPRDEPTPAAAEPVDAEPPHALDGLSVLVVDDEDDARELLTSVLEGAGAAVRAARSVAEALARIAEQRPDVLVSDVGMPEADGYALVRAVRELDGARLAAVALTAYARGEDKTRALGAGFDVHVPKPVDPAELIRVVSQVSPRR
ncbi:MAG TPA: response regulator, partial [Minicystis sp.]|nr:response regulator [Minicystis sp.]